MCRSSGQCLILNLIINRLEMRKNSGREMLWAVMITPLKKKSLKKEIIDQVQGFVQTYNILAQNLTLNTGFLDSCLKPLQT